MHRLRFFILLFAVSSLLFHFPFDFEVFADPGDVASTEKIDDSTSNGPTLADGDYFGRALANIGDLDGDGVTDFAVGAYGDQTGATSNGAVYIMFMNPNGTLKSTAKIDDSTANGPELQGSVDHFGYSVANMGDRDDWDGEDGIVLAVGAHGNDSEDGFPIGDYTGAVYIMFIDTDGTIDRTEKIDDSNAPLALVNSDSFGFSVANIGDLDGDGVTDIAVGAVHDDGEGIGSLANRGALHIMFMNPNGTLKSTEKIDDSTSNGPTLADGDLFGVSVAKIADRDDWDGEDGIVLAVGMADALHIMFMDTDGTIDRTVEINSSTSNGPTPSDGEFFGYAVANMGDLDGDGVTDIAVGAQGDDTGGTNRGTVYIMFMNTNGTPKSTEEINNSTANGPELADIDLFGISIATGDLDNDGVNDIIVGAFGDDTDANGDPNGTSRGAVYIMFMGDIIPSQVGTVTPTPGNTQVALSWSAPATGGAAITDYIIQYSTDNSTWSTFSDGTSTSTTATVTSLTNGTLYYFKVAAVNSVGTGTYSDSVSATPATTPSQVTSCTSKAFTNQAQLSWSAPATGGAAITDYIPQYSTDNSNWSTFSDGTSTSTTVTVTGLTNGVLYYFKVAAVNSVGTGPYCSSTSVTVDEYSTDFKWFPAGGSIGAGTTGECADFTAGTQTFGTGVIFGLKNGIPDGQVWEHAGTFNQFMRVVGANDFTAVTQTFKTGTTFGIDTTFNDGQTLPQYTITSSGVLLEEITCGTDTSSNTCIPNDVTKYLSPGEFLTTGIDTTETYSCISSNDKSFTIDGVGVTMSFDTITTSGDVKLDYYDPANVPTATANADGSVSISLASATGTTIGSIIDLSLETAAVTGDITITLPYLEANIPSGSTESDLQMFHYVNGVWITEDNCTTNPTDNTITCSVTSLSPFGVGYTTSSSSSSSSSGGGGGNNCDSNGFGKNNSLRVYEISYDVDSNEVQVQAYSTCGSISTKMTTPMQQSILGLSTEQPLLEDMITVYSGFLDESEEKFHISVQNKKQSFDETFYIHDKSITKKYTGETGYTSEQQGTSLPTVTSQQTIILSEPSVEETVLVENEKPIVDEEPPIEYSPEPAEEKSIEAQTNEEGGGCLIATATYGSEMAPQVQQLRELRDNQLLQTESGTAFMNTFNDIYYSFSPTIADMEREHPMFKEAVKLAITPMISSLSLMENVETESEVLGMGLSVIALNLGMYLGVPAIVIVGIRRKF